MNKRKIIIFFILYFLFGISVNIVHPITVEYVTLLNLPDEYFGFFSSLMSLGQVVGAILFGFLSDKIGRKWLVILGLIGYALSQIGFGFINSIPFVILIFRFLAGFFISAPSTLFVSLCIDYSNKDTKVKMLSILTSCYILGTSVGYEIGGLLKDIIGLSIDNIFIFQVCFTTATATLFGIFIKDVYKNNNSQKNIVVNKSSKTKHNYLIYLLLTSLMILTYSIYGVSSL